MKNIKDLNEKNVAFNLLKAHSINGGFRDKADLMEAQYHAGQTLLFTLDFLEFSDDSLKEKLEFLQKIKDELPKFKGK